MTDFSAIFPSMSTSSTINSLSHRGGRTHSVLPEGNTVSTSPSGTGATQSFGSILAGVTAAGNSAKRSG
jgi:hypothetical protein